MEYIFVGGKPPCGNNIDYTLASVNVSKNLLISLIEVLNTPCFKPDRVNSYFTSTINDIKKRYVDPLNSKLFLDSGGYSIIVGDVAWECIRSFIDGYIYSLENHFDKFDKIFSLDIPIFLSSPQHNNKQDIEFLNRESLSRSLSLVKSNQKIQDSFYFIWQFKIMEQYEVWSKLFTELNISPYIKNWALGGMVGLRGITQIKFSPFIGMMYKCLFEYLRYPRHCGFTLHSLGVYIKHDRFFISFIEKLFNIYLKRNDTHFTYDSVNYMRTAQYKVKNLDIAYFDGDKIIDFKHLSTPDNILKQVYYTDELYNGVKCEINNVKNGNKLQNVDAFTPLNIFSNLQLDRFFEYVIDKHNILDIFINSKNNLTKFQTLLDYTLPSQYPNVFTPRMISSMKSNFKWLWKFHHWFINGLEEVKLEKLIRNFISEIKFPAKLEEVNNYTTVDTTNQVSSLKDLNIKCCASFKNTPARIIPNSCEPIKKQLPPKNKNIHIPTKEKTKQKETPVKLIVTDPLADMKSFISKRCNYGKK